jgi:NADPH:quinone reductase-like Zn-dependent oxidoreductase
VETLAPFGRLVAFSAGGGSVDVGSLLGLKSVIGFTIGQLNRTRPEMVERHRAELWDLLAAGRLHPRHTDFPLEQVTEAIELVTVRANLGRVVLRTG